MANRQIYDTVFRDYFNHPARLLSLCNAVLRTQYSDPADIRPMFFRAVMRDGVIEVPDPRGKEVTG